MATITQPVNGALKPPVLNPAPAAKGVSLMDMFQQFAANMDQRMAAMETRTTAAVAAVNPAAPAATRPDVAKVAAAAVSVTPSNEALKAPTGARRSGSTMGRPCGSSRADGLICKKCNGPFNPVLHFSLDRILRLDGLEGDITHENWKTSRFLGVSVDETYWGNVVLCGFGKDNINLKPKTFLALCDALLGHDAAEHVKAVLPDEFWKGNNQE